MTEQRAKYNLENETASQAQAQPIGITLNSEQVKGILYCAIQKSPRLIVEMLTRNACTRPLDLLSEEDALIILCAIIKRYPNLAQKVIADIEKSVNS